VATRSTCSRLQVGCVISREGRILVSGYNGAPARMPHCVHDCDCIVAHGHAEFCSSLKPCIVAVHAEANAIAYAARHGIKVEGGQLNTTHSPCTACAQLIINAGIHIVVYNEEYRIKEPINLLRNAGVILECWT
jgi:dCMP deaminase